MPRLLIGNGLPSHAVPLDIHACKCDEAEISVTHGALLPNILPYLRCVSKISNSDSLALRDRTEALALPPNYMRSGKYRLGRQCNKRDLKTICGVSIIR